MAMCYAHASGVADHLADDDRHALEIARSIVRTLPPGRAAVERVAPRPPAEDPDGLLASTRDSRRPYACADALRRIVDGGDLHEFKELYGTTLVTASPTSTGIRSGSSPTNGSLFSESALKGVHFIELCDVRGIPLLFVQNIAGFMVGPYRGGDREGRREARDRRRRRASRSSRVVIGGSFGAGNYGMCGRAYSPRFLFTWPTPGSSWAASRRRGHGGGRPARGRRQAARPDRDPAPGLTRPPGCDGRRDHRPADTRGVPPRPSPRARALRPIPPRGVQDVVSTFLPARCVRASRWPASASGYVAPIGTSRPRR